MSLTRAQLNKAINDKIKVSFPTIPIQSRDVEEGFERPSFFVLLETHQSETNQFTLHRDMTARIRFFPTDRYIYKEEVYSVQDKLEGLFGLSFNAGNRSITIDSAESYVVDGVLQYDFNFNYFEAVGAEGESGPLMEELELNG